MMQVQEGLGLQSDQRICNTAHYRKHCENSEGQEYHGLPTKDIAELSIDDKEPCYR